MTKKVRDILPPEKAEEKKTIIPPERPLARSQVFAVQESFLRLKKALIPILFFLVLSLAFGYFLFPNLWGKAKVEIWPETKNLFLQTELTVNKEAKEINFLAKVIPGQVFEKEKTLIETFPSSGKALKEEKAEGMIKVYNEHSTAPQVLIATTRFVSSEGKIFRTPISVTVPGGSYQSGRFVPGEIDIKIIADKPGSDYNINASVFSIPGFAGTDRYTKFYAKSFQPMTGGFSQEKAKATKEDIDKAKDNLVEKARREGQLFLQTAVAAEDISSKFYYLLEESQCEIIENFSSVEPEEEVEEFQVQATAKCKILLFAKDSLNNFSKELISQQVPQKNKLYEESLKTDFSAKTVDFISDKMTLSLNVSAKSYPEIDFHSLKNALGEKSLLEAKIFLENYSEIAKVNVEFWPFWVKKIPADPDKIKIEITID